VAKAFVRALPAARRARAFWTAQSGMLAAQGVSIIIAGAAAQRIGPRAVVAIAGLIGVTLAGALATDWARHRGTLASDPAGSATEGEPPERGRA
jgi:hypothetical protein